MRLVPGRRCAHRIELFGTILPTKGVPPAPGHPMVVTQDTTPKRLGSRRNHHRRTACHPSPQPEPPVSRLQAARPPCFSLTVTTWPWDPDQVCIKCHLAHLGTDC